MAVKLGRVVLPKLPGDADLNGTVDFTDLLTLAQHYGKIGAGWRDGDFNANRSVGFDDLLTLAQNYGRTGPAAAAGAPAPVAAYAMRLPRQLVVAQAQAASDVGHDAGMVRKSPTACPESA